MTLTQRLQPLTAPFLWLHRRLLPPDLFVGWTPYLWLVWVGYFFIPFGLEPTSIFMKAATIAALVIFLPLYFRFYWAQSAERLWIIGIIVALGLALIPINGFCGALLIYGGAFVGSSFRPRLALAALVTLAVVATAEYAVLGVPFIQTFWIPLIIMIIGLANLFSLEQKRQHYALRRSQDEVKRLAATAERERIGRDLHDLLGHTLTLITVKSELAAKLAERDMIGAAREIREVERISREALQQVREAVGGYHTGNVSGELANARAALTATDIDLTTKTDVCELSDLQDSLLAMVLREAVTNVVRHSDAQNCRIELDSRDDNICLLVEDDGRGGEVREGNGLKGMRERLRAVSGRLDIASGDTGTRLTILIPANEQSAPDNNSPLGAHA